MEHTTGTVLFERSRIVVDSRAGRSGSVNLPEPIRKSSDELLRCGRVALLALNVQQQCCTQFRSRLHAPSENFERLRPVEKGICAHPDRAFSSAKQLFICTASIAGVQARNFRTGPHKIGSGNFGRDPPGGPKPTCRGRSRDAELAELAKCCNKSFAIFSFPQHREWDRETSRGAPTREHSPGDLAGEVGDQAGRRSLYGLEECRVGNAECRHDERTVEIVVPHLARSLGHQPTAVASRAMKPTAFQTFARQMVSAHRSFEQSAPILRACSRWLSICRTC